MKSSHIGPIEDELIESNGEISQALVEIKYARKNGLLEKNIDEIREMIKSAEFKLNVTLQELEEGVE